jgi:hypothetical protein
MTLLEPGPHQVGAALANLRLCHPFPEATFEFATLAGARGRWRNQREPCNPVWVLDGVQERE